MMTSTHTRAGSAIAMSIIFVAAVSPAVANQSAQRLSASISMLGSGNCPLERVGTEFVRCDNLSGAGVPAAPWVPELKARELTTVPSLPHGSTK